MIAGFRPRFSLRGAVSLAAACICFTLIAAAPAAAAWWDGAWQYRTKIDADTGPKGANIGDPIGRTQILVRLHAGNFKFDTAKPDGSDIRFIAGDDRTPLHYHIEKWDGLVDQVALIWVDVPDLAPGTTTNLFMYWGNDKANSAEDAPATYDGDQLLVWHFNQENGLPKDVTAFKNDALTPGKRDEAGIIGFGTKLDGTAPIKLAPNPTLNITAGETFTWQIWAKPAPANQTSVLYDQRDTGGVAGLQIGLNAGIAYVEATPATGPAVRAQATSALVADSWHLITMTAAADKLTLYVDGAKAAEAAGGLPAITGGAVLGGSAVAAAPAATPGQPAAAAPASTSPAGYVGELDELQISKVVRQTGAIEVATHSQGPQANLLAFENPEQTSSFGSGYIGIILKSVTIDAWVVIGILIIMMLISWLVMVSKALSVGKTAGANKRFRAALRETAKKPSADLLPPLPKDRLRGVAASSLFHIYDTGMREVNDRLQGGRCLPDGTIAPQSLAAIRASMDAQLVKEAAKLNNLMVLLTIAISGGPFVGLLGTVIGVMITFAAIAAAGDVNVNSIAPGISAALLATATGMFVAIPALFGYNYFQVRIKGVITEMSVFVDEIVTRIAEGRLGQTMQQPGE
jgi:biopolymer transport protein ExbB